MFWCVISKTRFYMNYIMQVKIQDRAGQLHQGQSLTCQLIIIALTDGQVHDKPSTPFTAPFHALIAGHKNDIDRRLTITQAPSYGIVGKTVTLTLRIDDQPKPQSETATLRFRTGTTDTTTTIATPWT